MNKNNSKVFPVTGLSDMELPIIGEDIRCGDTLRVICIKHLNKTTKQLVDYLLLLDNKGIIFESINEPYFNFNTEEGSQLIEGLRAIREASKTTLSNNSKSIKGAGAKEGSYNKDKDAAIVGMYAYTQNVSAIAAALDVSRNTVYKSIDRHNLK